MAWFGKFRQKLHVALRGEFDVRAIAGGVAVGVFFSFTFLLSLPMLPALASAVASLVVYRVAIGIQSARRNAQG